MILNKIVRKTTTKVSKNGVVNETTHAYTFGLPETKEKIVVTSFDNLPFIVGEAYSRDQIAKAEGNYLPSVEAAA